MPCVQNCGNYCSLFVHRNCGISAGKLRLLLRKTAGRCCSLLQFFCFSVLLTPVLIINTIVCKTAEIIAQMLLTSCSIVAHPSVQRGRLFVSRNCGITAGKLRESFWFVAGNCGSNKLTPGQKNIAIYRWQFFIQLRVIIHNN